MSLQLAAKHLSSHGRGNDSTLVHMSPREVSSLNAIAKAHGGHLTTNPHTGLPEAGFLESILPMAAGAALTATGVGAPMAALMVGGGMALATGSLEKGLMAGLGAYGGSSLGASLLAGGASPAAVGLAESGAASAAATEHAAQTAAAQAAQAQASEAAAQAAGIQQAAAVPSGVTPQGVMNSDALRAQINTMSGSAPITASPVTQAASATPPVDYSKYMGGNAQTMANATATANAPTSFMDRIKLMGSNISPSSLMNFAKENPLEAASGAASLYPSKKKEEQAQADASMGQRYAYSPGYVNPTPNANAMGQEQTYANPTYTPISNEQAKKIYGFADGGATPVVNPAAPPVSTSYTAAQPTTPITSPPPAFSIPAVNSMADLVRAPESQGLVNAYLNRPAPIDVQAQYNDYLQNTLQSKPMAVANSGVRTTTPTAKAGSDAEYVFDAKTQKYVKNPAYKDPEAAKVKKKAGWKGGLSDPRAGNINASGSRMARGSLFADGGGISDAHYNLGGYSDGGRLLRGPGDGVSDSIPAVIGKKQPARLADGEFVVPARIVSELGNGSTEAGARKLYAMMDRIQKARGKTVGKGKVAKNSRSEKYLPA